MLINLAPLADNAEANAENFNSRFAAIANVLNGNIEGDNLKDGSVTSAKIAADVLTRMYPVGSLYFNATDATNPGTLLAFGTWVAYAAGRVPVGYNGSEAEFNAAEKTGGAKTHTLTSNEMPSHNHSADTQGVHSHNISGSNSDIVTNGRATEWTDAVDINAGVTSANGAHSHNIGNAGGGAAHNNLQPFVTVYIWKRTA